MKTYQVRFEYVFRSLQSKNSAACTSHPRPQLSIEFTVADEHEAKQV